MSEVDVALEANLRLEDRPKDNEDHRLQQARAPPQPVAVTPHAHSPEAQGEHRGLKVPSRPFDGWPIKAIPDDTTATGSGSTGVIVDTGENRNIGECRELA
ncbi:MAG TPA: hypothetical protein VIG42_06855 [Solirubrobacteraceae bacterium]